MLRLLLVALFFEMGLALLVVPWSSYWDRNFFIDAWPWLREVIANRFVRGAVSGLGVVNLSVGVSELWTLLSIRRSEPSITSITSSATGE